MLGACKISQRDFYCVIGTKLSWFGFGLVLLQIMAFNSLSPCSTSRLLQSALEETRRGVPKHFQERMF